jgi:hypothetical protein
MFICACVCVCVCVCVWLAVCLSAFCVCVFVVYTVVRTGLALLFSFFITIIVLYTPWQGLGRRACSKIVEKRFKTLNLFSTILIQYTPWVIEFAINRFSFNYSCSVIDFCSVYTLARTGSASFFWSLFDRPLVQSTQMRWRQRLGCIHIYTYCIYVHAHTRAHTHTHTLHPKPIA